MPVHDADAVVHRLYEGEAVAAIEAAFPGTTADGKVDRTRLGARVLNDAAALKRLEAIIHPLVQEAERRLIAEAEAAGKKVVVLDIPLLFETGADRRMRRRGGGVGAGRGAARARARTARDDAGKARRDPRQADAGCRKARPRRFRRGYLAGI